MNTITANDGAQSATSATLTLWLLRATLSLSPHTNEGTVSGQTSAATSSISPTRTAVMRSLRLRTTCSTFRLPPNSRGLRGGSFAQIVWPTR
jgi:hypothetical protein